jgi:hypothetical protein
MQLVQQGHQLGAVHPDHDELHYEIHDDAFRMLEACS